MPARRSRAKAQIETIEENTTVNDNDFDTSAPATDIDVDAPIVATEDTVDAPATEDKPAKEAKSTRPPVPEGFIAPVAFAKTLGEHLTAKARETDPEAAEITVKPQVVYSYIKNNPAEGKNPFPAYKGDDINPATGSPYAPGRSVVLKADEGLAWWDAKTARVAASKQAAAEKASKKAKKDDDTPAETVDAPELVEAE